MKLIEFPSRILPLFREFSPPFICILHNKSMFQSFHSTAFHDLISAHKSRSPLTNTNTVHLNTNCTCSETTLVRTSRRYGASFTHGKFLQMGEKEKENICVFMRALLSPLLLIISLITYIKVKLIDDEREKSEITSELKEYTVCYILCESCYIWEAVANRSQYMLY